jgi:hypothetical protein
MEPLIYKFLTQSRKDAKIILCLFIRSFLRFRVFASNNHN